MAEALALIGLVASITQFLEYGHKLLARLDDIASSSADRPNAFVALKVRLPAVLAILGRIQHQIDNGVFVDAAQAAALGPVIENSIAHVRLLLGMLEKALPGSGSGAGAGGGKREVVARYFKALRSLSLDAEVQRVSGRLQENLQVIALVQTTGLLDVTAQTARVLSAGKVGVGSAERTIATRTAPVADEGTGGPRTTGGQEESTEQASLDIKLTISDEDPEPGEPDTSSQRLGLVKKQPEPRRTVVPIHEGANCSKSCSCICHRPYQLSTPTALVSLFGHLSVNYGGQAFVKVPCNEKKCKRLKPSAAHVTYRFPGWALGRVIHMAISSTALNTKVNLNTMRVLPDTAEVFSVISAGDLTRLRTMFKQGEASIYDISRSNWTLVHSAFTLGKFDVCKFLIAEGADLSIDAANGSNVIERAWFMAQKLAKTPGDYVMGDNDILREVDLDDFVSSQQYNLIHKIVLGISKVKLADVLASSTAEIDGTDIRGATPLSWAAAQGNLPAIVTLLEYGANPNPKAAMAQTPLHLARNAEAARLLLQYRAEVDARDSVGRTPLHCYCYRQVASSPLIIKEILDGGASIDAVAYGGQTALHYAAMFGNANLISVLLEYGADINAKKNDGLTPLMSAVRYDQAEVVKCLVDHEADWTIPNYAGQNILHVAARYAGVDAMKVVAELDFTRVSSPRLKSRDNKGRTPEEYFADRKFRSEDLEKGFERLVLTVGRAEAASEESESLVGDNTGDVLRKWSMPGSFDDT